MSSEVLSSTGGDTVVVVFMTSAETAFMALEMVLVAALGCSFGEVRVDVNSRSALDSCETTAMMARIWLTAAANLAGPAIHIITMSIGWLKNVNCRKGDGQLKEV